MATKRCWCWRKTWVAAAVLLGAGCSPAVRSWNTTAEWGNSYRGHRDSVGLIWFKTCYLYPARDYLALDWLGRCWSGDEAWNVTEDGEVADGPFYTNRRISQITPETLRALSPEAAPVGPWRIRKAKGPGATKGFVGTDSRGRAYLVKLDHDEYPELGTAAEVIGSRLMWLLGYQVLPVYLVRVEGTGDPRYDGRRATATLYLEEGVLGGFKFDHFRMRREVRALRMAAAWLDDVDRVDNNTLAVRRDGRMVCYQIDFNSCLGSWNGRPKEAWRGHRHAWDVERQIVDCLTLGLLPPPPAERLLERPSLGRLDLPASTARQWRGQNPNTAFDRMTHADAEWMARRLAEVSEEQIRAIVRAAEYEDPANEEEMCQYLLDRRRWVLRSWGVEHLLTDRGQR